MTSGPQQHIARDGTHAVGSGADMASTLSALAQTQPALTALVRLNTRALGTSVMHLALNLLHHVCCSIDGTLESSTRIERAEAHAAFRETTRVLYQLDEMDPHLAEAMLSTRRTHAPDLLEALEAYLLTVEVDGKPLDDEALGVLYALARTAVTAIYSAEFKAVQPGH